MNNRGLALHFSTIINGEMINIELSETDVHTFSAFAYSNGNEVSIPPVLAFEYPISCFIIARECYIVLSPKSPAKAYDRKGKILWCVNDIICRDDLNIMDGAIVTTEYIKDANRSYYPELDKTLISDEHEYANLYSPSGHWFLLDITEKRLLTKGVSR